MADTKISALPPVTAISGTHQFAIADVNAAGSSSFRETAQSLADWMFQSASSALTGSFTGSATGSLQGSASFATTSSAATSITFIPASASFATTASAATSITFAPVSSSYATTASWAAAWKNDTAQHAWGKVLVTASSASLMGRFGIGSINKISTGALGVTWSPAFADANYSVVVSVERVAGAFTTALSRIAHVPFASQSAGTCSFQCTDDVSATSAVKDPAAWHIMAFGT